MFIHPLGSVDGADGGQEVMDLFLFKPMKHAERVAMLLWAMDNGGRVMTLKELKSGVLKGFMHFYSYPPSAGN